MKKRQLVFFSLVLLQHRQSYSCSNLMQASFQTLWEVENFDSTSVPMQYMDVSRITKLDQALHFQCENCDDFFRVRNNSLDYVSYHKNISGIGNFSNERSHFRVPKIIHQTWKTQSISTHSSEALRCQETITLHSKG